MSIPVKIRNSKPRDVSILWFELKLDDSARDKVRELCTRISDSSQGRELDFIDGVRCPQLIFVQVDR